MMLSSMNEVYLTHQLASHRNFVKAAKDPKNSKNTSSLSSVSPNEEPSTQGSVMATISGQLTFFCFSLILLMSGHKVTQLFGSRPQVP